MRSNFLLVPQKILRTSWRNGCSYKKGSLGRDMPSIGTLVGLLLASTWQAASALLELSSSTLSSWCGLCQRPGWAPYRLSAHALAPWACSWSLQGHKPNGRCKGTVGWRVASRTLGQGFKPLRCRIAPRIRSQGLKPHMSNQGTLEHRYQNPHSKRGLHLDRKTKTIQPSPDKTPGIVPH